MEILVIADDMTGAADTGVQFCPYFQNVYLISHDGIPAEFTGSSPDVLAVHTDSRASEAESARNSVRQAASRLKRFAPRIVYKKTDSCMRGNMGAEIDAVLEEMGFDLSFIAPAFPKMGRTTEKGVHYVNGIPVSQTEMGP